MKIAEGIEGRRTGDSFFKSLDGVRSLPATAALICAISGQVLGCVSTTSSVRQTISRNGVLSSTEVEVRDGKVTKCEMTGDDNAVVIINGEEIKCNE